MIPGELKKQTRPITMMNLSGSAILSEIDIEMIIKSLPFDYVPFREWTKTERKLFEKAEGQEIQKSPQA